jgi:Transposase DDE domain
MLVDALVTDALAALGALDGQLLPLPAIEAGDLLALVAGQDVEQGEDGVFRIARKTARDRVISTVDTQARHGHKSRNRRFDGYKAHLSVDPDSELIDEVAATPANTPDRDAASELLGDLAGDQDKPEVVGDSAYGDAATRAHLEEQGFTVTAKCPPAHNAAGRFPKDRFAVDLGAGTVTRPGRPPPSSRPPVAAAGHRFAPGAPPARCGRPAPRPGAAAPSPSTRTRRCCSAPAPPSVTPPGSSATKRTGPSSSARSPTSPAGPGAAAGPAPAGWPASPPILSPVPEPSTGPGSRSSGSNTAKRAGHYGPPDHPGTGEDHPSQPTHLSRAQTRPANSRRPPSQPKADPRATPGNPYFSAVLAREPLS